MTLPVFIHDGAGALSVGSEVELGGDEGRHAVVVRRVRIGEQIVLTDGAGAHVTGTVTHTAKASLTATVDAVELVAAEEPHVTVVQAIPKGERAELAVEMLTEVGVDVIVPWAAERCVGVWREDRAAKALAKWRSAAREAAKQARRVHFPEVTDQARTPEVAALLEACSVPVVLHETASGPIGNLPIPGRGGSWWSWVRRVGSPTPSSPPSPRSVPSRCGWAPPCCVRRPRASPPWLPSSPAPAAGASPGWPRAARR